MKIPRQTSNSTRQNQKALDVGMTQRSCPAFDCIYLSRLDLYTITRDLMIKKYIRSQSKFTFTKFIKKLVILEDLKNYFQMVHMIILIIRVYQCVINKDNHKQIKIASKNSIHKVHESHCYIF